MVREYKVVPLGEHGDGIARSEFHKDMFGQEMVDLFEQVKRMLDPDGVFNPNKIVHPQDMMTERCFVFLQNMNTWQ